MPNASKEAVAAIVTRMINDKLHSSKIADDPELTLKPDCTKTLIKDKKRWCVSSYHEM